MNTLAKRSMMAISVVMAVAAGVVVSAPGGPRPRAIAAATEFGDGAAYDAWITSVTPGSPSRVTMEMAWHYTGQAAVNYAKAHGLPAPADDHMDVDWRFSATVDVSPSVQASINPQGAGTRHLSPAAFLAWAGAHPAAWAGGQYAGPIYRVTFARDVLVSAKQIFEP
jgi:hypothetical protein